MTEKFRFHIPFSKDAPKVALDERVLYIPPTCDRTLFTFPGWYSEEIFGAQPQAPIAIEFCSGNGSWILEKARRHPEWCWVAVEKRFDRVKKIWAKMRSMKLTNVLIVFGEAIAFSSSYVPSSSVQKLYINFPDPWPKRRHMKHRIVSATLFSEAARILSPHGEFVFVTDCKEYSSLFECEFESFGRPYFAARNVPMPEDYGTSFFDTLFRGQGKTIQYHDALRLSDTTITTGASHVS